MKDTHIRLSENTRKNLRIGSAYFGCTMGTMVDMLLDAVRLAEMPGTDNLKIITAIERFEKHLSSTDVSQQNYLFKD